MGLNLFQDGGSSSFFLLKVVEGDICGEESFHHHVTAVACKRPRSFCQKRRWQVTAKHAYILRIVALHEVTWCIVVWCTKNAPRRQQFHVAPAMPALHVRIRTPLRLVFKNAL